MTKSSVMAEEPEVTEKRALTVVRHRVDTETYGKVARHMKYANKTLHRCRGQRKGRPCSSIGVNVGLKKGCTATIAKPLDLNSSLLISSVPCPRTHRPDSLRTEDGLAFCFPTSEGRKIRQSPSSVAQCGLHTRQ